MAGDWIKLEHATRRKPEVLLAAELLGIPRQQALGLFVEYFCWLDDNLPEMQSDQRNAFVTLMSRKGIDEALQCSGFSVVLERIGWAIFDDERCIMTVVNAGNHNGNAAKSRALNARRQKNFRNARVTLDALPEKRREEKSITSASSLSETQRRSGVHEVKNGEEHRKATRLPTDWQLPDDWRDWACTVHHLEPQRVVRISLGFRDYWVAKPKDATSLDWKARWRMWIRKECGNA